MNYYQKIISTFFLIPVCLVLKNIGCVASISVCLGAKKDRGTRFSGWLIKSSVKQLFTEGDLLAVWLLSDSVLWGFHDLHRCGTVRENFAVESRRFGIRSLHISEANALFIFRYLRRLSLFYLLDVRSLSR